MFTSPSRGGIRSAALTARICKHRGPKRGPKHRGPKRGPKHRGPKRGPKHRGPKRGPKFIFVLFVAIIRFPN